MAEKGFSKGLSSTLTTKVSKINELNTVTKEEMWKIFSRFYSEVEYEKFFQDLFAKNYAIICRDKKTQEVKGFSTIHLYRTTIDGKEIKVLFSGDTILSPDYWGYKGLQLAFAKFSLTEWFREPLTPFYWFLISKGYKTYLLMTKNFVNYWPRHGKTTPDLERKAIEKLALSRFSDSWVPETGCLVFKTPQGRLKNGVVPISSEDLKDPDIQFFVKKNPGHALGNELCCLAEFSLTLWLSYMKKNLMRTTARIFSFLPQSGVQHKES